MKSSANEENLLVTGKRIRELEDSLREERLFRVKLDRHMEAIEHESRRLDRFYESMYFEWKDSELRRMILLAAEENAENRRQFEQKYSREVEACEQRRRSLSRELEKCRTDYRKTDGGDR